MDDREIAGIVLVVILLLAALASFAFYSGTGINRSKIPNWRRWRRWFWKRFR